MHEKPHSVWDLGSSVGTMRMAWLWVGTAGLETCVRQLLRQLRLLLLLEAGLEAAGKVGHGHFQLCHLSAQPLIVVLHSTFNMSSVAQTAVRYSDSS